MTTPFARYGHDAIRCSWVGHDPAMVAYHDTEWGFPVADDRHLFEKLCLETFQSGLSWRTILNKRESFRTAFAGFRIEDVACFDADDVERLMGDVSIVRNRAKIEAVINNAARAIDVQQEEGSLADFLWRFSPPRLAERSGPIVATTPESVALAKELKRRGWKFLGPTTVYALMQSMGMVNDHDNQCVVRGEVERALDAFHS